MYRLSAWTLMTFAAVIVLIRGREILIPLVLATILWFVAREVKLALRRVRVFRKYVPSVLHTLIAISLMVAVFLLCFKLITSNIEAMSSQSDKYEQNLNNLLAQMENLLPPELVAKIGGYADNLDVVRVLNSLVGGFTRLMSDFFMIAIYAAFIFFEESSFKLKLRKLFPRQEALSKAVNILGQVEDSVSHYFVIKTYVSLLTGVLSYFALLAIGIDSASFWAFLIFLLNYIPTIGSLVATLWPAIFSLLQLGSFTPFLLVLGAVGAIQLVVGNIVEPRVMGKSLNISPLVTILSLTLWGQLWGVTGMVLSVPITVIMVIVMAQFESTRKVSILLSADGEVTPIRQPPKEARP